VKRPDSMVAPGEIDRRLANEEAYVGVIFSTEARNVYFHRVRVLAAGEPV
jgi:hypothetical protein